MAADASCVAVEDTDTQVAAASTAGSTSARPADRAACKATCKHGKRPVSGSTKRLQQLQQDWAAEVAALKSLEETSSKLERRRQHVWGLVLEHTENKKRKRADARRALLAEREREEPFMTTSGMRFGFAEPWQPYKVPTGRSSRRTAYVTDYNGLMYTGPERHSGRPAAFHVPRHVAMPSAAGDAAGGGATTTSADARIPAAIAALTPTSTHAAGTGISALRASRSLEDPRYRSAITGRIAPHKMPPAGKPSQPPTASFQGLSCRRRRWYTDYTGKRILVDSSDMPSVSWAG